MDPSGPGLVVAMPVRIHLQRGASLAQIFSRRSNALVRWALVCSVLGAVVLGLVLGPVERSAFITRQGERPSQPVPYSHKMHVAALGLECQYCHTTVERSSAAGIPSTRVCMNCHNQIGLDRATLEPLRLSWKNGRPMVWERVNRLPGFVRFSHEIHVAKGVGCATCHGRVDQMRVTSAVGSLQMEWCVDCHRHPEKYLQPTAEVYNMSWQQPSIAQPVWCTFTGKASGPTSERVACTTVDPMLQPTGWMQAPAEVQPWMGQVGAPFEQAQKFTSQRELGSYLAAQYKLRSTAELTSCEVCHS